jgi:hypothetical protein
MASLILSEQAFTARKRELSAPVRSGRGWLADHPEGYGGIVSSACNGVD